MTAPFVLPVGSGACQSHCRRPAASSSRQTSRLRAPAAEGRRVQNELGGMGPAGESVLKLKTKYRRRWCHHAM